MPINPHSLNWLSDLARLVKMPAGRLSIMARGASGYYKKFSLPKKNGGERLICCPSRKLKSVQAWILKNILNQGQVADSASGFLPGKNIGDNAQRHIGGSFFLCLDLEDFFPSISEERVYKIFRKLGIKPGISRLFTRLCTCEGKLPQGSPASPALSNLACYRLDQRIKGLCRKRGVVYSRYADDLTFSAGSPGLLCGIKGMVQRIIREEDLEINKEKTRFLGPCKCRKVTGMVVGNGLVGIGRKQKRKLRAGIHHLAKKNVNGDERQKLIQHLDGWLAFLNGVDKTAYQQLMLFAAFQGVDKELKVGSGKPKTPPGGLDILKAVFELFKK